MILGFNYDHIDPLMLIMGKYQSMCEGPTVVSFTTVEWSLEMKNVLPKDKWLCSNYCRCAPAKYWICPWRGYGTWKNNQDVFIYHEDDIIVKHSHLVAYLSESKMLRLSLKDNSWSNYCIGFQRYRRLPRGAPQHANNYGEQDIYEQDLMEETPNFRPICIENSPYLAVEGNIHQGMWVLTKEHVDILQEKCGFLNQSSPSREYMSSFSLFNTKKYHCSLMKILPGPRLTTFVIHHFYQQRHVS